MTITLCHPSLGNPNCLQSGNIVDISHIEKTASSFDPVKRYLDGLPQHDPERFPEGADLANVLFGCNEPLDKVLMDRWLVGAVARVYNPGCEMHGVLTLQGAKGTGKSQFYRILGGAYSKQGNFHTVLPDSAQGADKMRLTASAWIVERGEISGTFSKQAIEALKDDITNPEDKWIPKYREEEKIVKRRFVYGAADNHKELLVDPTGNRRFWILSVKQKMDRDWLIAHRDDVWAYAVNLYKAGHSCHLDEADQDALDELSVAFEVANPWEDRVAEAVDKYRLAELLKGREGEPDRLSNSKLFDLLGMEPDRARTQGRYTKQAMDRLGWIQKVIKVNGRSQRGYLSPTYKEPEVHQF